MTVIAILTVVVAYLLGSINFAVIFSNVFLKKDVRNLGSGNAGTTNVMRNAGFLPGALTFLCDVAKGFLASFIGREIFEFLATKTDAFWAEGIYGAYLCGLLCMAGHIFPIFFGFKGGKGVATSVGIFLVCSPLAIGSGIIVFCIVLLVFKMVSLSSILAAITVVASSAIFFESTASITPVIIISVLMGTMVILKHKDNIKRIIAGEEPKILKGGKK